MALTLRQIAFQADLVSKPVRDNFTDIENFVNDLQDQIDGLTTPPAGSEVTDARDYHSVLRDRLRSASKATANIKITGGSVTVNADTTKLDVASGEAIVNGIACKWSSATSASLTASAANKHRVDLVVVNSDSTISIVSGSETDDTTTNPAFPIPTSSQLSLAAVYVDDTSPVNNTGRVFNINADIKDRHNVYFKIATTLYQGKYQFNNVIVDSTVTLNVVSTSSWYMAAIKSIAIDCAGALHITSSGSIVTSEDNKTGGTGGILPYVGGAAAGAGTGGGGGGASLVANGGEGSDNGGDLGGAGGTYTSLESDYLSHKRWFTSGIGGSSADKKIGIVVGIRAYSITNAGEIKNEGGQITSTPSAAGGNGGGITMMIAEDAITNSGTISCKGGNGGNNSGVGGGGGGGGGGLLIIRSNTYTNTGTVTVAGGTLGAGGTGGANGDAGILDQKLHTDNTSVITIMPLNIIDF